MNLINTKMYNTQWKQLVTIAYIDSYGFAIDTVGIQHDTKFLRPERQEDTAPKVSL